MPQVQLTKLVKAGLMLIGGATLGHLGAFAGSVLGSVIGNALGTFASGLGEQTIGLGLEHLRQLFQKDPNLSNILLKALEDALSQLREQRRREIGVLPDDEDTYFKNWLSALKKGQVWGEGEAEKVAESFLAASGQEEEQILWNMVEGWLKENAGTQVPEPLLRFLRERLPENLRYYLHKEISENQQVFNQLMLSLMSQILQIVQTFPEEVRKTLEPEIQKAVQQIERQQQQFFFEVLGELAGVREQLRQIEDLVERIWKRESYTAKNLLRLTWDFIRARCSEVFVGRKDAFDRLNKFLSGESGVAIVYAPPGYGKTTFLANWVWRLAVGEWRFDNSQVRVFRHFFNPNIQYSRLPSHAYAHLLAQISFVTQKQDPIPPEDERHAALSYFFHYEVSVPKGEKWVIVLDGLDDAEGKVKPFIPDKIPEGLFVVVSGRWDGEGELPNYLKEWAKFTEFIPLKALSEEELREWLRAAGEGELAQFAENDDFVRMLREKTDGLPLFVRYLMDDLLQAVKEGKSPEQVLERTPKGFSEYVKEQFRQLAKLVRNEKGVRDLFALLTVAKGALRQDEVEELTGLFTLDLEDLPHQVTRWFSIGKTRSSADMPTADMATYSFAHPLLAEEFRKHLGKEARQMEERLLKWCENWREHPSFPYILRHYAEHLYEKCPMTNERMTDEQMTNYAELCRLALDPEFAQAQTQHLPDEPNLPLKTVQLALDAAIQLEDAPMMARLLIEHAKRAQEETPFAGVAKRASGRALELATDIVFKRDHKLGTLWSLLLAWVAESEGEREWAKRFLDEIRKRWEGEKLEKLRDWDWQGEMAAFLLGELGQVEGAIEVAGLVLDDESKRRLATSWASKRLFDQALKVAEGIEEAWRRARALGEIAEGMAKEGMFDQALKVAEGIEKARWRAWALREIAEGMAKAGMFDQALKVAEGIEKADWRAEALIAIAEGMAKEGMFDQALKVAEGIKWAEKRAEALIAIAVGMAKAGMIDWAKEVFDQALKVAEGIEWASERAWALRAIAGEMAKAGMTDWAKEVFDQALKVAEGIESARRRARALIAIAGEMAKAGMTDWAKEVFDQALKVAEGIEEADWRAWALREIAEGMAKEGMFDQALKVAEGIKEAWWRAGALREIAEGMAKEGMFDQALKVAEGIEEARWRAGALIAIAGGMAKAGMIDWAKEVFDQALKVAEGIEEADWRAWALREIAEGMAKAGMFDQALKVAEGIESARRRARALIAIAGEMAKAGMIDWAKEVFDQALKVAEGIEEARWRAGALIAIAGGMAKAGMIDWAKEVFDQALKVAEGIEEARERARALIAIAGGMAKAGMIDWAKEVFDQALKVAEGIEEARWRAGALIEIAGGMAKAGMFDQALGVAEGIEKAWRRARALSAIAGEMAKAGMIDWAKEVFDQ
jgi:tetratricopeptide (TPR) repeat protein